MQQVIVNRRDAEAERSEEALEKAHSRWLQTEYPVTLAEQLIDSWQKASQKNKADTSATLRRLTLPPPLPLCPLVSDVL